MPAVLSVIALIAVVSAAAFVFAFVLVSRGGASTLASTEKHAKHGKRFPLKQEFYKGKIISQLGRRGGQTYKRGQSPHATVCILFRWHVRHDLQCLDCLFRLDSA